VSNVQAGGTARFSVAVAPATSAQASAPIPSTAASSTGFTFACLINVEPASVKFVTVQPINRCFGFGINLHLDKCKATALATVSVGNELYLPHGAVLLKEGAHVIFSRVKGQIADE
jgi:hypothetical protein